MNSTKKQFLGLIIIGIFSTGMSEVLAQENLLEKIIRLEKKEGTVRSLLGEIGQKGDFIFSYSPHVIPVDKEIVLSVLEQSIRGFLEEICQGYPVEYYQKGNKIIIARRKESFSRDKATSTNNMVSGTILDSESGEVIPGVNITVKGTNFGSVSDIDGTFHLQAPTNGRLVFSSVGYASLEIKINHRSIIPVILSPDIVTLSELIVTGYSVSPRSKTNGSVSTVAAKELTLVPSGNVEQQLQGRVTGVTVVTNGQPGTSQVRVHGFGSGAPLYVVDGVAVGSLALLAPGDIQSVSVLKDASEASIYGARAAGGVIAIVTRQGTKGARGMKFTYDGMIGVTTPGAAPSLMNPQQQADWTWNAIRNAAIQNGQTPNFFHPQYGTGSTPVIPDWLLVGGAAGIVGSIDEAQAAEDYNVDFDAGPIYNVFRADKQGVDWYDAITRNAFLQRHNIGLYGGGEGNRFYVGLSMQEQQSIIKEQNFERYTMRVNTEFDILPDKLRIGENIQATYWAVSGPTDDRIILNASRMSPIIPIRNEFGGYAGTAAPGFSGAANPIAIIEMGKNNRNFNVSIFGNVYLEYEPIEDLVVRTSFGGRYGILNRWDYRRRTYENAGNTISFRYRQFSLYTTQWVWTNTVNYSFDVGDNHSFGVLGGYEALNTGTFSLVRGSGINPFSETTDFVNLSTVENRVVNGGHSNGDNFSSVFGKLTYDFKDKYLITGVVRNDGSSRFGAKTRRGTFPSFSAGWRLSEEAFLSGSSWIDDLKIRGGYGIMGNSNNVDPNNQFSLFSTSLDLSSYDIGGSNTSAATGFYRSRIGNPFAQWEKAITTNIGIDALLWDGKVDVVLDVWQKDIEKLLFVLPITVQTGFNAAAPDVNVGEMRDKGVDLMIKTIGNIGREVGYELTVNASWLNNEIISFGEGIDDVPQFSVSYGGITPVLNQVGQPLSTFYGFKTAGLFANQGEVNTHATQQGAAPGRFRFEDINNDGVIDQDDRTSLGSPVPDFTGGINLNFHYRNFDLIFNGYASIGNEIYNISKLYTDFYTLFPGNAISSRVLNSWTFEDPTGAIPIFENVHNFSTTGQSNSFYVEDGSYFRLQNITLAYNFPGQLVHRWGFANLKVFASGTNLFTITDYQGLDPGVGGFSDFNFGIDNGNIPVTKGWNIGVSLGF